MNYEEALKVLTLESNASAFDISSTAAKKITDLQKKISSAPTDALKAKFQQLLDKVIEAELVLSQPPQQEQSQPKRSGSPLSETKMADLPGMAPNAGTDSSAQTLQPGSVLLDRYEIKAHIAQGGMGVVYRAFDKNRGADIAIKVMLPQLMQNETARERFLDEARLSSQLSHPNIVNVYDVQQQGDLCFLTMELLEGQDLRELMENRKLARQNFSVEEVLEILTPICAALDHAHELTVHRDIKPENIFLTEEGKYKLMDFGIARVMSTSQRTQTGAASGTAYYMAPEQLKGAKDIDGRADQYALAVLTYELLSGEVPAGAIEPLHELVKGINKKLSAAVQKALSPKPENRFDSLTEFLSGLQGSGKGVAMPSMPALPTNTMGIAAGVVGAVILLIVLVSSGALSNLGDLLPQSTEEISAQKAEVAKLQGEIKTYKQRLDNGRRQLSSDLRDASRNKSSDERNLENWQTLTDNYIFNGNQITDLEGDLSMGESLLRDDGFEQAKVALTKVRNGYKILWDQFNAAEKIQAAESNAKEAYTLWAKRKKSYKLDDPKEVIQAQQNETDAAQNERNGAFVKALSYWHQAEQDWRAAYDVVSEQVATLDSKRKVQRAQAKVDKLLTPKQAREFLKKHPGKFYKKLVVGKKYSVRTNGVKTDKNGKVTKLKYRHNKHGDIERECIGERCTAYSYTYDKHGNIAKESTYKVSSMSSKKNGAPIQSTDRKFDSNGKLVTMLNTGYGKYQSTIKESYKYDGKKIKQMNWNYKYTNAEGEKIEVSKKFKYKYFDNNKFETKAVDKDGYETTQKYNEEGLLEIYVSLNVHFLDETIRRYNKYGHMVLYQDYKTFEGDDKKRELWFDDTSKYSYKKMKIKFNF